MKFVILISLPCIYICVYIFVFCGDCSYYQSVLSNSVAGKGNCEDVESLVQASFPHICTMGSLIRAVTRGDTRPTRVRVYSVGAA